MGALTRDQADLLEEVHKHRHDIAHELPKVLVDPDFEVNVGLLIAAARRYPERARSQAASNLTTRISPPLPVTMAHSWVMSMDLQARDLTATGTA